MKVKFIKIDFARITKDIFINKIATFIIAKNFVVNDVDALIVDLNSIDTNAKVVKALISSLKTFFIQDFVTILKSIAR